MGSYRRPAVPSAVCTPASRRCDGRHRRIRLKFDGAAAAPNFETDRNKPPTAPTLMAIRSVDGKRVTGSTYRVLSESEYAARAGAQTAYSWGDDIELNGTPMADCNGCGSRWDNNLTAPVGSFSQNRFGLYDMEGNVWEWTEDCVHENYNGAPTDGSAWIEGGDCNDRMVRGGAWVLSPATLRSAYRIGTATVDRGRDLGFRVARTLLAP
jgi:formylglycine-generating enzyme required for sulfatase activity